MTIHNETLAVIGSPSTNEEMTLDILERAKDARLVGALVRFMSVQDNHELCVTGQITSLSMFNKWHQNDVMRNIIKSSGSVPHLSGSQDVRFATLSPGAVFGRTDKGSDWGFRVLGNLPPTGTAVERLQQSMLEELVHSQKDNLFYVGRAYGDGNVRLPMYFKHFGDPKTGGQGEAYHILIAGKTGSGKSTVAKMALLCHARHADEAILIVDPKGEFADEISNYQVGSSGLQFANILKGLNRKVQRYGITQVRLEGYELFEDILLSLGIDSALNIRGADNKIEMATAFTEIIRETDSGLTLDSLRGRDAFAFILDKLGKDYATRIYKGKEGQEALQAEIDRIIDNPNHRAWSAWEFVAFLFSKDGNRQTIGSIVHNLMASDSGNRPLVVLDLSVSGNRRDLFDLGDQFKELREADEERDLFTDSLQKKIIYRIVSSMRRLCETIVSERVRAGDKRNVNTLVLFEEAHRFAPKSVPSDDEDGKKLKAKLVEAVRETRKYGLGWAFIDQTIGGLDKEIIQQVRCFYIGYGLSMGEELQAVREIIGGDQGDVALYRSFKDPASYGSVEEKMYPWMAFGPISPMSANHPLFFNAFGAEDFVKFNNMPVDSSNRQFKRPTMAMRKNKATGNVQMLTMDDLQSGFLDD